MSVHGRESAKALKESVDRPDAFGSFYNDNFEPILAFLTRRTYDADLGLELTAETFAQAFLSRRRFRGESDGEAQAWLYRIAVGKLSHFYRRSQVETKAIRQLQIELPPIDDAQRARIEQLAELDGLRVELKAALGDISPALRDAVGLRVIGGLSYGEMAETLEISEPTARARVSRGLRKLAAALDGNPTIKEARQ